MIGLIAISAATTARAPARACTGAAPGLGFYVVSTQPSE
jgi:hypothetical protein